MKPWVCKNLTSDFFFFLNLVFHTFYCSRQKKPGNGYYERKGGRETCDPKKKTTHKKTSYCKMLSIKSRQALQSCRIKKLMKAPRLHPQNHWGMIITDNGISGADT